MTAQPDEVVDDDLAGIDAPEPSGSYVDEPGDE